jgi:hypothetical protein
MKRFTIGNLMAVVLLIAVGFAALRNPLSTVLASVVFTLAVVVLLTATLGSVLNHKGSWIGFALFGWGSLLLAFGPCQPSEATPIPTPLTTMIFKELSTRIYGSPQISDFQVVAYDKPEAVRMVRNEMSADNTGMKTKGYIVPYAFLQTGNSLFSLLAACVGCVIGRVLSAQDDRSRLSASAV